MEDQCSPLSWGYYYPEEGIEELKHSLLYTTLELETTILSAHEEISSKEDELVHLKDLLTKTIKERDEARTKCQMLMLEKAILHQHQLKLQQQQEGQLDADPLSGTTSSEDETKGRGSNNGFSSSDSNENILASQLSPPPPQLTEKLVLKKPLPENGKFLQAVVEAGPLLQTLLLAGPLPQWQHPPPQLNSVEIPPVTIPSPTPRLLHRESSISTNGCLIKKRVQEPCEASD